MQYRSAKLYVLNGQNGSKTGLCVTVRVMAGDTVSIFGKSYYHLNSGQTPNNGYPVTDALLSFLNAFTGTGAVAAGTHASVTGSTLNGSPLTTDGLTQWLNDSIPTPTSKPKAYINWVLFDDQFKPVNSSSGFSAVNTNPDIINTHTATANITKNGYLYVYCSNESDVDVFFDNLQVVHSRGPLLEETHYYPWGLTMVGISSKAAGSLENRYKFNGGSELQHQEFSDGSGLDLYETELRSLDPQIGRWWQVDPKPADNESPYSSMGNNPILHNDVLGDTSIDLIQAAAIAANQPQPPKNTDGDQSGLIRNATDEQYKDNPSLAFLKDVVHVIWSLLGVNAIDNFIADRQAGKNSAGDVLTGVVNVGLATTRGEGEGTQPTELTIDATAHPEAAEHAQDATNSGVSNEGFVDRAGKKDRRADNLRGVETAPGRDRDEFPPAVINNQGGGNSVRLINPSDNRGAGASLGQQLRALPDGTHVVIKVINLPPKKS